MKISITKSRAPGDVPKLIMEINQTELTEDWEEIINDVVSKMNKIKQVQRSSYNTWNWPMLMKDEADEFALMFALRHG